MNPNLIYHYQDYRGNDVTMTYGYNYRTIRYSADCRESTSMSENADGDVTMTETYYYCNGWIDPDNIWHYSPPAIFLDLPLTVGKRWTVTDNGIYGPPCTRPLSYEIVAEQTITVPAGTFDTMVLVETDESGRRTYYLDHDLGPVMMAPLCDDDPAHRLKLASIETVVPTLSTSWGTIKTLYR